MSAGSKFEYLWREEKKKKPIKACAVERCGEEGGGSTKRSGDGKDGSMPPRLPRIPGRRL